MMRDASKSAEVLCSSRPYSRKVTQCVPERGKHFHYSGRGVKHLLEAFCSLIAYAKGKATINYYGISERAVAILDALAQ